MCHLKKWHKKLPLTLKLLYLKAMKPSEIIYQLRELNSNWRSQDFNLSKEQQAQYNHLISLRRERVQQFYKEGRVSKGGLRQKDVEV